MTAHDKKPSNKKKPVNKWSVYGSILGIFIAINIVAWMLTGLIAYPTAQHREVSTNLTELTTQALGRGTIEEVDKALASPEIKQLEASSEAKYSAVVNTVLLVAQLIGWIALIGFTYNYLRKKRIGKDQPAAVALIDGISAAVVVPFTVLLSDIFYPVGMSSFPGVDPGLMILAGIPFTFIFSVLLTYIVARIFQWRYNRKYNFAVE